jgi:BirA family transcriptional regulator, biotin operon repressor / biotin---[acetyl-CoA-carboxylase] ligase
MTVWLRSTASTMNDAAELAAQNEPHGTVVVAEEQTAGIGRHGHSWHSERGAGLYLSIIIRLPFPPDVLPLLTMALGLGAQQAVEDFCGVRCDIRWPNDLLFNEKKLAGIMVQSAEKGVLIAGIGINVNHTAFPEELSSIATSLRIETGREYSKDALLNLVVERCLEYSSLLAEDGRSEIVNQFEARSSYARGKAVEVGDGALTLAGVTCGLDSNGFLRLKTATGVETVIAGGVRPVKA